MFTRQWLLVVAFALTASSIVCDDVGIAPIIPGGSSTTLCPLSVNAIWQNPLPFGNDLYRMWGFSDDSFVAVGDAGTIVRYSGLWTVHDSSTRNDLHGIWADSPSNIYACGSSGTLLHFDGTSWKLETAPTEEDLYGIWVSNDNTMFLTGNGGSVWRRQAGSWQEFPLADGERFRSLCGYSAVDVYAGGSNGHLFHFDGVKWTRIIVFDDPLYEAEIMDMWASGVGTIAFVDRFNMLWFDGTDWNAANILDENAFGIWGFSLSQQVAVSAGSSTRLVSGVSTRFLTPSEEPLFDVWGPTTTNCYAVGRYGTVAHFNGTNWEALNAGSIQDMRDIWATPTEAIAVGQHGSVLRQTGALWTEQVIGPNYDLNGVWTDGDFEVAVGRFSPDGLTWRQAVLTNTDGPWSDEGSIGAAPRLFDVWGSSSLDLYAVGWAGEIIHRDSTTWRVADWGNGDAAFLTSISGTAPNNIVAVGRTNDRHALVCHFNGVSWAKSQLNDVEELYAVWVQGPNAAIAVGASGAIRSFDGTNWTPMTSPTTTPLLCVSGFSPNDIYAGGIGGKLLHYDGTVWRELLPPSTRSVRSIAVRSPTELYLAGDKGSILLFQGF